MSKRVPDYDELQTIIAGQGEGITAAECHGLLCGMLTCEASLDGEGWVTRLISGEFNDSGEQIALNPDEKVLLKALVDDTREQLSDPGLGFQLMLPNDETSIQLRTEAMATWCEGYLFGLSLGGIKDFNGFSEHVKEFAADLVEIARLSHEDDDSEENENAFFEVVEYVRMGVLMMCDELASKTQPGDNNDIVLH